MSKYKSNVPYSPKNMRWWVIQGQITYFTLFNESIIKKSKLCRAFSKFYRRHFDIVSKYNVGLKTFLLQGLSEPEFYGDLVYKFRKIIGKNDFPYHFKKIIVRYKKIGYNINVNSFAYLFICTTVGRTSD